MAITVLKWPSKTVHAAKIVDKRIVPLCRPHTTAKYNRLPGHMTVSCKDCIRLLKARHA